MTKILILVGLLLVGCGGAPFAGGDDALAGAGGDASEAGLPGVSVGGSDVHVGGSSSSAGKAAGGFPVAAGAGGSDAAAGAAGAPAGDCEFDPAQLTAALPTTLVWNDFTYTDGALCVTCRDKPCGSVRVISWGVPHQLEDGRYVYLPNVETKSVSINFGANDGACTKKTECGVTFGGTPSFTLAVVASARAWKVSSAVATIGLGSNTCVENATGSGNTAVMSEDLAKELEASLAELEIPCK